MADRPNIVLIITDQQRYDTIGALGFAYAETPNLDRLVNSGVAFTDCHVTAPSCAPSRASLFTGQYPHATGVLRNGDAWPRTWIADLSAAGYHCVNVGKMHTRPFDAPTGFHERYVVENKDRPRGPRYFADQWEQALQRRGLERPGRDTYAKRADYAERLGAFEWELPSELHPDVYVGNRAVRWIEQHQGDAPFFLEIGFPGPHPPYDPLPDVAARTMQRELPVADVSEADLRGQPPPFEALRREHVHGDHDACRHVVHATIEQRRRQRAYYLANVTMIDEQVGQILAALARCGHDDTIVIFISDHGDCLGDHGHSQKWTMYDVVTRVPLVFWSPGRIEGGRRCDALCQLMDVGATILEFAGVEPAGSMAAISLAPGVRGEPFAGRECVFAEHGRDNLLREISLMSMIRTRCHKLVYFHGDPYGQLFDLCSDPGEERNLWDDPAFGPEKAELIDTLLEWRLPSELKTRQRPER